MFFYQIMQAFLVSGQNKIKLFFNRLKEQKLSIKIKVSNYPALNPTSFATPIKMTMIIMPSVQQRQGRFPIHSIRFGLDSAI